VTLLRQRIRLSCMRGGLGYIIHTIVYYDLVTSTFSCMMHIMAQVFAALLCKPSQCAQIHSRVAR